MNDRVLLFARLGGDFAGVADHRDHGPVFDAAGDMGRLVLDVAADPWVGRQPVPQGIENCPG